MAARLVDELQTTIPMRRGWTDRQATFLSSDTELCANRQSVEIKTKAVGQQIKIIKYKEC